MRKSLCLLQTENLFLFENDSFRRCDFKYRKINMWGVCAREDNF